MAKKNNPGRQCKKRNLKSIGTENFPMTVNHDDLWSFEGKNVPIHWIMISKSTL